MDHSFFNRMLCNNLDGDEIIAEVLMDEEMTSQCHVVQRHKYIRYRATLRFRHRTRIDFDKICVFCGKCCVGIDKCVFIVLKIKCVNSSRISDICDKVNFTTKLHIFYNT